MLPERHDGGSQLQDTNEALTLLFDFLFGGNSFLTWVHIAIGLAGFALVWWAGKLDSSKLPKTFRCPAFGREVIQFVRGNASAFLTSFGISFALFLVGVALEDVPSVPSLLVQVLTYMPTIVLALVQLLATFSAIRLVKKHTGL